MSVGMQTIIGFSLAMLVRRKFFGSGLITTLILVPMMISPVVVGMFWKMIYNPNFGFFNFIAGGRGRGQGRGHAGQQVVRRSPRPGSR